MPMRMHAHRFLTHACSGIRRGEMMSPYNELLGFVEDFTPDGRGAFALLLLLINPDLVKLDE